MMDAHEPTPRIGEAYPINTVVGVVDDAQSADATVMALEQMLGFGDVVEVVGSTKAVEQLAQYQRKHPWKARVNRLVKYIGNESEIFERYRQVLNQGDFIVIVPVADETEAGTVANTMQQQGSHYINYFGPKKVTTLVQ